jgi:hypothetical protein
MRFRSTFLVAVAACAFLLAPSLHAQAATVTKAEPIFSAKGGLAPGWQDIGWAPRTLAKGSPASLDLSNRGGWIVAHPGLAGRYGWVSFRLRAPASFGAFLEVGLDSAGPERFPRVRATAAMGKRDESGFVDYKFSVGELNPKGTPFDRVVFRAAELVGHDRVQLDDIALLEQDAASDSSVVAHAPGRRVHVKVDCGAAGRPINPLIYSVGATEDRWWESGTPGRRWGGNPTTRYNWEEGRAWNTGSDWFFRNASGLNYDEWIDEGLKHGAKQSITVPMIGWVAKDTTSYSFPVSQFGPQRGLAPENKDMGDGVAPDGTLIKPGPAEHTSIAVNPDFVKRWIAAIREKDKTAGRGRSVTSYILDNEPTLWNVTHRDVHPRPVSYDELLEKTIAYGSAVRDADPTANIAGFVGWGWTGYFFSGVDVAPGGVPHVDRISHGNTALLPWWLRKVREYEKGSGKHIIDLLDVHFYPQGQNMGLGAQGGTDPDTAARRIRSTRALWDGAYSDESWISEPQRLIPRLREWINDNAPGIGISIGEYNFGAEQHMSGGLAVAEALGRFGEGGVFSAYYWTSPKHDSPAFWAFRAYRNFDGNGGHFLSKTVPAEVDGKLASAFVSRDSGTGHLVAVLLNLDPATAGDVEVDFGACGKPLETKAFTYTGTHAGFVPTPLEAPAAGASPLLLHHRVPPYSMTVLDLTTAATR